MRPAGDDGRGAVVRRVGDGAEPLRAQLRALAAHAAAEEAAAERTRLAGLEQAAAAGASLTGVAVALAERAEPVTLTTAAGRRWVGTITATGPDFLVMAVGEHPVFVPMCAVALLEEDARVAGWGRRAPRRTSLVAALADVAATRPLVHATTGGLASVRGRLDAVGRDVVRLVAGDRPAVTTVHLAMAALDSLVVLEPC